MATVARQNRQEMQVLFTLLAERYNYEQITDADIGYMVGQLEEMIPVLEMVSGNRFNREKFQRILMKTTLLNLWSKRTVYGCYY